MHLSRTCACTELQPAAQQFRVPSHQLLSPLQQRHGGAAAHVQLQKRPRISTACTAAAEGAEGSGRRTYRKQVQHVDVQAVLTSTEAFQEQQQEQVRAVQGQQQQQPQQQQQQHHSQPSALPPQDVWRQELRHLLGLMVDPNKPLWRQFVLQHCYCLNSSQAQAAFRGLTAAQFSKLIGDRQRLEARSSKHMHALADTWRRLLLLAEGVREEGLVLSQEQMAKEREQIAALRDRIKQELRLYERTVKRAAQLGDTHYLHTSKDLQQVLAAAFAASEAFLSQGMSRIAGASRVNELFRNAWLKTPPAARPAPATAEAQRQAQLSPLLPLLPDGPDALVADYRRCALRYSLHRDKALQQRRPHHGLPRSSGGAFWQQQQQQQQSLPTAGPAGQGVKQPLFSQEYMPAVAAAGSPAAAGGGEPDVDPSISQQTSQQQGQQQEVQEQQQQQVSQPPQPAQPLLTPPLQSGGAAAWQQPPQQLLARPVQQLPLLPHLAKPWVRQATLRFRQQQKVQQQEEEMQRQLRKFKLNGWPVPEAERSFGAGPAEGAGAGAAAGASGPAAAHKQGPSVVSLSGKTLPPLSVLLRRCQELERHLLSDRGDK